MQEPGRTLPILQELRELGVTLAIDDFGAQHSSLSRLRDLPVEALKVDRSFLRGVPGDGRAEEILRAILGLAHALGVNTVAEGVETEAQRLFLAGQGCRLAQGFHLGRPVPADEATRRLLEARRASRLRVAA